MAESRGLREPLSQKFTIGLMVGWADGLMGENGIDGIFELIFQSLVGREFGGKGCGYK